MNSTIANVLFEVNKAKGEGGALSITGSPGNISETHFYKLIVSRCNSERGGGGIFLEYANAIMDSLEITFNLASEDGGGIHQSSSTSIISNSTLARNTGRNGGGVYLHSSTLNFVLSPINFNLATLGTALYLSSSSTVDLYSSILSFPPFYLCSLTCFRQFGPHG